VTTTTQASRTVHTGEAETATEEPTVSPTVSPTGYQPTLTGALAREHVTDLLRTAGASRAAAQLPRHPHHTPRRRPLWWVRTALAAAQRTA
jgi:hypothetical protein